VSRWRSEMIWRVSFCFPDPDGLDGFVDGEDEAGSAVVVIIEMN
jgi:hypothetical protein